jgi:predicted nucleic acid-binding Zn ribbon protein
MTQKIISALTRSRATILQDAVGVAALLVMMVVLLYLPTPG